MFCKQWAVRRNPITGKMEERECGREFKGHAADLMSPGPRCPSCEDLYVRRGNRTLEEWNDLTPKERREILRANQGA